MPDYEHRLLTLAQRVDDRCWLSEIALFSEHSLLTTDLESAHAHLERRAKETLEALPAAELHRRRWGWSYALRQCEIAVAAPSRDAAWQQEVRLTFDYLCWSPLPDAHLAFVPALEIEVLQSRADKLEAAVGEEIRAALERLGATSSLEKLVRLQRRSGIEPAERSVTVRLPTPKERALREQEEGDGKQSVLKQVGVALGKGKEALPEAFEADETLSQLAELLGGPVPRSVLLVGPAGVGKTAAFYQLVRERRSRGLATVPFWATSGARLVAGMSGYGMWQKRSRDLCREASKTKVIVYLGNLVELAQVGRCVSQSESIASFLRPYLLRGELVAVTECTPEQLALIERELPQLLPAFVVLKVEEPSRLRGRAILERQAAASAANGGARLEATAVETLDRLHRRYAGYSAYPGRPLRLLKNLSQNSAAGSVVPAADVTRAFSRETGLPLVLLDDDLSLDLVETETWFAERVRGQHDAVELVVGLLATVKAGLTRPGRPVASLLFIGPTGVGKTEMSKALAEFLYQRPDRIVRFDMTEYADYAAVERLAGGATGSEGLLTSRVREQPFTVVLFDEFEKAHPRFFDLLLQVLGEARLTDAAGRLADFSNSVVIMTSNLGAESFQRGMTGFGPPQATRQQAHDHFARHVRQFLRPELFNRIDRIVPFAPLDEATVAEIARRELAAIERRDGIVFGGVTLDIATDVGHFLARQGYEPRFGARPLKRAIERQLLAPLAAELNRYSGDLARAGEIRLADGRLQVAVRARLDRAGRQLGATEGEPAANETARRSTALRRSVQSLERSTDVLRLRNEVSRLTLAEQRWLNAREKGQSLPPPVDLNRLARLRRLLDQLSRLAARTVELEDAAILAVHGRGESAARHMAELPNVAAELDALVYDIFAERFPHGDRVLVAVFGEDQPQTRALAHAYFTLARRRNAQCYLHRLTIHDRDRDFNQSGVYALRNQGDDNDPARKDTIIDALHIDPDTFDWHSDEPGVIGMALVLHGRLVYALFEGESGLHTFRDAAKVKKCLVTVGDPPLKDFKPPAGIDRRGSIGPQPLRRNYDLAKDTTDDALLGERLQPPERGLDNLIAFALEEKLRRDTAELIAK